MKSATTTLVLKAADAASATTAMKAISDAMTEVGFVKHTTAGQIDLTAPIAYPGVLSATTQHFIGFEIRKLVAAGKPTMYAKIHYMIFAYNTTAASAMVSWRISWGTTVDAGGNIGGSRNLSDAQATSHTNATMASTAFPTWIASDGQNYFTMLVGPAGYTGFSYPIYHYTMERTRDQVTGVYDGQAVLHMIGCHSVVSTAASGTAGSTSGKYGIWDLVSAYSVETSYPGYATPANLHGWSTGVAGASALFPLLVSVPAIKSNATCAIGYYAGEIVQGTEFNATMYGSTITFVAGGTVTSQQDGGVGSTNVRPALRIN